ncbi:MAG: arylsulfatase [Candidatus Brocadiae bacterium]|nr:arylsulfatase [Candidatus Brocadiia bacterium]
MHRREFLGAMGAAVVAAGRGIAAPARKPNIIFIMVDDLGYGDLGCYGQKLIRTPHLDRMAAEGTKFTDCYAGSAVCAPTRCVLMTGLHSGHCTRRGNRAKADLPGEGKNRGLVPLRPTDYTVATHLRKAGYVTGGIGKWGLGNPGTTGSPDKHGFDHFYGYLDQVHAHSYYPTWLWRNDQRQELAGNQGGKRQQYAHDLFEADTLDFIRRSKGKPFFLYLPYTIPHGKYEVPDTAPYTAQPWPKTQKNYAAMITRVDATVGKLFALLRELGLDEHTLVFFTSDNGPNPPFLKLFHSAGGLRGIKRSLYEGGIRMPMIVRWPGKVPAGKTSDFVWTHTDFFPTACELAGTALPKGLDGMSVLPTLLGSLQKPHDALYWEFHAPFHQAVRMGRWKGVRFGTDEPLELYDLATDRGEKTDITAQHPDVVRRIETFLATARTESPYWPAVAKRRVRARGKGKMRKK